MVSHSGLFASLETSPSTSALEAGVRDPITIYPNEPLSDAVELMTRHGIDRLPVIDHSPTRKLLGLIKRRTILKAMSHQMDAESIRPRSGAVS